MKGDFLKNPKVLDLFSGAGGLSLGFQAAGFTIVGGVDIDINAIKTYAKNFPNSRAWLEDLNAPTLEYKKWETSQVGHIDVIVGGPPCQGFSLAGKRNPDDPRNLLYIKYMDAVEAISPKYVVIENVPNIASMNGGAVKRAIVADLEALGYVVQVETLNASHFGVPQARRRTFFVGSKPGLTFTFPKATTLENPYTSKDAISDLPSLDSSAIGVETQYKSSALNTYQKRMRTKSNSIFNHELVRHTQKTIQIVRLVPDGGNYKDLPEHLKDTRRVNIAWTRMNSNKPSFTIDAGHNHHFHYSENRVPSVRECARIQSFPDDFEFLGPRTSQYRQVGNAVPPTLAQAIAIEVLKSIND